MSDKKHHPNEESSIGSDFLVPVRTSEDGIHVVRHHPDHSISSGMIQSVKEGKPMPSNSEIVRLTPDDGVYKVETLYTNGPPKVNSTSFRSGWERTFGKDLPN